VGESENQHKTNLEVLNSFDLIITTSIMQSDNESMSVSETGMATEGVVTKVRGGKRRSEKVRGR